MSLRNIRVLIQAEEDFHLSVISVIPTGKLFIFNDIVHASGADRPLEVCGLGLVNEGGVNRYRVNPVLRLHPGPVCRHRQNPAPLLFPGQAVFHCLGTGALSILHVGGRNPVYPLSGFLV